MHSPESNDSLSRTLQDWRVAPARDPQFRPKVWARIAGGSAALPWSHYARQHAAAVGGALALALVVGAVTGLESARSRAAADRAQLAAAYVQAYDARAMALPR